DAPPPQTLSTEPARLVTELDNVWERPSDAVLKQVEDAAASEEPIVRHAALQALGRLALPQSIPLLVESLADPSKLVQRTAAWALRQVYGAHPEGSDTELAVALASENARARWGATRVFAHQFAALATRQDLVGALEKLANDPVPAIRMQAVKALWQDWFWNADP